MNENDTSGNCQCFIYVDNQLNENLIAGPIGKYKTHIMQQPQDIIAGENMKGVSTKGTSGSATGSYVTQAWSLGDESFEVFVDCPFSSSNKYTLNTESFNDYLVEAELVSPHGIAVVNVKVRYKQAGGSQ